MDKQPGVPNYFLVTVYYNYELGNLKMVACSYSADVLFINSVLITSLSAFILICYIIVMQLSIVTSNLIS